jgi:hypothetical protein
MKKFYMAKISELPKGSIVFKARHDKKYPYLVYRDGSKIRTDYIKADKRQLKELEFKIKKRKKYSKILVEINKDLRAFGVINNE